jgi:peptidoglycan/LPS O-acetylase OafA/YrhL
VITAIDQTLTLKLHTPNVSSVIMAYGVTLPIALMVGMAMYVCVERPCMDKDWPRKFWHWFLQRTERRAATEAGVDCST